MTPAEQMTAIATPPNAEPPVFLSPFQDSGMVIVIFLGAG